MIPRGETVMTIFDSTTGKGRVIDGGGGGCRVALRLIAVGIVGLFALILLFNCVTRVGTGQVGVLTLFGRVTGETLPEGRHLTNPLRPNNRSADQNQRIK